MVCFCFFLKVCLALSVFVFLLVNFQEISVMLKPALALTTIPLGKLFYVRSEHLTKALDLCVILCIVLLPFNGMNEQGYSMCVQRLLSVVSH